MTYLSQTENRVLMAQAREALKGRWGLAIGTFVVAALILMTGAIPIAGIAIIVLIAGPMSVGVYGFTLSLSRREDARLEQIFDGFRKYGTSLAAYVLVGVFTLLWALLLVIPGYMAMFSYFMTFHIISENDSIRAREAIKKSKEMMQGNRWKLLCLCFRFGGWSLLCGLTLGVGLLWLLPYMYVSIARFYDDLKPVADAPEQTPAAT